MQLDPGLPDSFGFIVGRILQTDTWTNPVERIDLLKARQAMTRLFSAYAPEESKADRTDKCCCCDGSIAYEIPQATETLPCPPQHLIGHTVASQDWVRSCGAN